MTTTVGIVCDQGVVLATDKRATMGSFIATKKARKVYDISERIGMTTAGTVGDLQKLVRFMKSYIERYNVDRKMPMTVKAVATVLANILNGYWRGVQILIGGVVPKPCIFSVDGAGGVTEEDDITATGSGSPTAYGALEALFKKGMSIEECKKLAVRAVYTATKRDSASGGDFFEVVAITQKKGYETETITREEVKDYIGDF